MNKTINNFYNCDNFLPIKNIDVYIFCLLQRYQWLTDDLMSSNQLIVEDMYKFKLPGTS